MVTKQQAIDLIAQQGILPLYFNADETVSVEVLRAIYRAGIKAVEYTNRGEAALSNFKKLVDVRNKEMQGMVLGVGTVKNLKDAESYLNAGADFLVSPGYVAEVATYANNKDVFYGQGVTTVSATYASEIGKLKSITSLIGSFYKVNPNSNFRNLYGVDRKSVV